jgi:L-iditol 2-dehydrogenase
MKQAIIASKKNIVVKDAPKPTPAEGEVLVRLEYNAICGSEFPAYLGIATGLPHYLGIVQYPFGPFGHEGAGEVVELGEGVTDIAVGDRVVACGGYMEYNIAPAKALAKIPDGISFKDASISAMALEAEFAARFIGTKPEDSVLISGMGPGGLLVLEAVREIGPKTVICLDILEKRLEAAKKLGATHTLNPKGTDVIREVQNIVPEEGISVAIDTTGIQVSIKTCFKVAGRFGRVGIFGRALDKLSNFEIEDVFHKFLTVYGLKCRPSEYTRENYARMLGHIAEGKLHPDVLVTHEFPLGKISQAFEMAAVKKEGLKVVVKCT